VSVLSSFFRKLNLRWPPWICKEIVCVSVCLSVSLSLYTHTHTHTHTCTCTCIRIHIHTYVYTYKHTYIYIKEADILPNSASAKRIKSRASLATLQLPEYKSA
jgi:hypothetical protein